MKNLPTYSPPRPPPDLIIKTTTQEDRGTLRRGRNAAEQPFEDVLVVPRARHVAKVPSLSLSLSLSIGGSRFPSQSDTMIERRRATYTKPAILHYRIKKPRFTTLATLHATLTVQTASFCLFISPVGCATPCRDNTRPPYFSADTPPLQP